MDEAARATPGRGRGRGRRRRRLARLHRPDGGGASRPPARHRAAGEAIRDQRHDEDTGPSIPQCRTASGIDRIGTTNEVMYSLTNRISAKTVARPDQRAGALGGCALRGQPDLRHDRDQRSAVAGRHRRPHRAARTKCFRFRARLALQRATIWALRSANADVIALVVPALSRSARSRSAASTSSGLVATCRRQRCATVPQQHRRPFGARTAWDVAESGRADREPSGHRLALPVLGRHGRVREPPAARQRVPLRRQPARRGPARDLGLGARRSPADDPAARPQAAARGPARRADGRGRARARLQPVRPGARGPGARGASWPRCAAARHGVGVGLRHRRPAPGAQGGRRRAGRRGHHAPRSPSSPRPPPS